MQWGVSLVTIMIQAGLLYSRDSCRNISREILRYNIYTKCFVIEHYIKYPHIIHLILQILVLPFDIARQWVLGNNFITFFFSVLELQVVVFVNC